MRNLVDIVSSRRPPDHITEECSAERVLLAEHGIRLGVSTCPACGEVYTLERLPSLFRCLCGRPTDQRCAHRGPDGARDCRTMVPPEQHDTGWYHTDGLCDSCRQHDARRARERQLETIFATASQQLQLSRDYSGKGLPEDDRRRLKRQREPLDAALQRWFGGNCGRDDGAKPWIIAIGPTGLGKTVAFVRYTAAAYLSRVIDTLVYVTEDDLLWSISRQWDDDERTSEAAVRLVQSAQDADVLVLDEAGKLSPDEMTRAQRREYPRLLKRRIDSRQPVLVAMNRELSPVGPFGYLDSRLDSRCADSAVVVRLRGVDLRRDS